METISNILASFDIFQVLIAALPMITDPLLHSFHLVFNIFSEYAEKMVTSHPGLTMGVVVFLSGYVTVQFINRLRRYFTFAARPVRHNDH